MVKAYYRRLNTELSNLGIWGLVVLDSSDNVTEVHAIREPLLSTFRNLQLKNIPSPGIAKIIENEEEIFKEFKYHHVPAKLNKWQRIYDEIGKDEIYYVKGRNT